MYYMMNKLFIPTAYSTTYNYIIIWNAKCGCTYFRQLFLELHKDELKTQPRNEWHELHNDFSLPKINIDKISKIMVCRNPYRRVVSMFCNKYCGTTSVLPTLIKLQKVTFKEFVNALKKIKQQGELNNIDIHIVEQSNLMYKNTEIVKLENFNEGIIDAYKNINLDQLVPNIKMFLNDKNVLKNQTIICKDTEYVYDKEYSINNTVFPDYKFFFNVELLDLVYYIYKEDFIRFGYKKYEL